jgi:hypothetical protein
VRDNNSRINLSGSIIKFFLGTPTIIEKSSAVGASGLEIVDTANGQIRLALTKLETIGITPGLYRFEFEHIAPLGGFQSTFYSGIIKIAKGINDNA